MIRKTLIAIIAISSFAVASPAMAGKWRHSSTSTTSSTSGGWSTSGGHHHHCGCGHKTCNTSTSSSSSSSGGSSTGGSTSSSSSSGTQVPEPGMLGLAGAGLIGLGSIRLRRRRKQAKK